MNKSKEDVKHKVCSKCIQKKVVTDYYLASNEKVNLDGRVSICKVCLSELIDMEKAETLVEAMRMIDRPFLRKTYDDSKTHNNPFGEYMRMLATRQNRTLNYLDSEFEGEFEDMIALDSSSLKKSYKAEDVIKFKVTPAMILRWGDGYSEPEIFQLEQFYVDMEGANSVTTPQHREQLKLLCKLNLEQNKSLGLGKVNDFKNLNTQYNKILENSGFRPIDKLAAGESAGIRTFSQVFEEIEKDGFIPKHNVEVTQDIVDKTIMYVGNYTKRLLNAQVMSSPPDDTPKVDEEDEL